MAESLETVGALLRFRHSQLSKLKESIRCNGYCRCFSSKISVFELQNSQTKRVCEVDKLGSCYSIFKCSHLIEVLFGELL